MAIAGLHDHLDGMTVGAVAVGSGLNEGTSMTIRRVAVIFDDRARPETTGVYCRRALERLVDVAHFQPDELDHVPREGRDLYFNIDDGFDYRLPSELRPSVFWAIDTHVNFDSCLRRARGFDLVFAAQRDGADRLRRAGIATAAWLPLACDPEIHRKHEIATQYDVAFVGNVFPGPRQELLELIRRRHRNVFIGQCYFDEMARTYSAARIVFNRSIGNDVNMRVFEALACGSLLLTNDLGENGQSELFQDGVHLATYREPDDLLDKLAFYLRRDAIREKIAAAGRAEVLSQHTYGHRMERMLREAEVALARMVVRPGALPLEAANWEASIEGLDVGRPTVGPAAGSEDPRRTAGVKPTDPNTINGGFHPPYKDGPAGQDPFYFGYPRPEVLALVPESARRVLDIGCGAGRLGEAIKARQQAEVVGIEMNEEAAAVARQRLDHVLVGDVEELTLDFEPGSFDAIVCGDILEHLREPERLLRQARKWLAPGGCLSASIPNVRHHSVVCSLLQGNWTYESAGLLDRTHLRFFTRREIEKLFVRAGFGIEGMWSITAPGDSPSRNGQGAVQLGRLSMSGLSEQDAAEFYTYQYLVRARPVPATDFALTSIVIVTHNQLEYARQCLESIRRLTDEPYELIVVDNASTDGTVDYLHALSDVRLITNETNRGFPAAANRGMAVANGRHVLLLNNDTVVTTGWLSRMLQALRSDATVGLVGPCSNFVSGPQQVDTGYDGLAELDGFGWDWGKAHEGLRVQVNRLVGFCLLIRREVIDAIGLLDERFGIGCFEDDDYCLRAIQAGYRAVIAADAFVHHYGGRTFVGSGVDVGQLMAENRQTFCEKWARAAAGPAQAPGVAREAGDAQHALPSPPPLCAGDAQHALPSPPPLAPPSQGGESTLARAGIVGRFALEVVPGGGLRLRRAGERPRLSLCMIVRDSARTLPACLESIRPWVDEMVIVDTGSVDETPRIVEAYGGRLFHFPWSDDFSAARNESLRHARAEWLFWMDSDDTIPWECGRKLRALIGREVGPSVLAFVVQVHCPGGGEDGDPAFDVTVVDHVKLFRNRPDLRFDGRIHEQVLPAIRCAGGEVAWSDVYVVHSGSDQSPEAQRKKFERDLRILELELSERPEHPFTLFNLGMTYVHAGRSGEAAGYLRRSIARSSPDESHLRKVYALLVYAEMRLGCRAEALETCRRGLALFPHDVELRFREGVLLHELGRLEEARRAYSAALTDGEERHFSSVDRALTGFKAHQNLAVVASDMGDLAAAEIEWRDVVCAAPRYRQGWRGLGETLIRAGRFPDAETIAEELARDEAIRTEGLLLKSRVAIAKGQLADARIALDSAVTENPDDLEVLRNRCQFFFEHGETGDAESALKDLIGHDPDDASAHHNLGTLLLRTARYDEAVQAYRQSLRFRSNCPGTFLNLGCALKESGRIEEAVSAWAHALRLAPGDPAARQELARVGRLAPKCFIPC
jgi:glycosyltransferase involved in cell wall biosynthesis/tetratricopeptide (TPR) repeat protein/2-polyprenyl-3-methyl-5-hydroxy-6-metoxy-1,4-benzoquinol methylase